MSTYPAAFDGWIVETVLGEGDFGAVYRVHRDGIQGALKTCPRNSKSNLARLQVEAESLTRFSHRGIPELIEERLDGELPYIVMSLAQGQTILQIVNEWRTYGRVHGDVEVVTILSNTLSVLAHIHSRGYTHRDIKEANIIIDLDSKDVSIIDFGFCKESGSTAIRDKDSFWRAGAARFAPLSKLDDPSTADPTHDIFAVGVIGYLLLTDSYPWSVSQDRGIGALRALMRSVPLAQAHHVNSMVSLDLSRFLAKLLVLDDDLRPDADAAFEEIERIKRSLSGDRGLRSRPGRSAPAYTHVVRDQIHGDVRLTDYEFRALNTPEMQRLRWIKQLGLTNMVYPGAEHSRLAHSIGTLSVVETMLRTIEEISGVRIDPDTRSQIRLYALTHDYSHVAAGHTVEDQLGIFARHDDNYDRFDRLINREASVLGSVMRSSEVGRSVLEFLSPRGNVNRHSIVEQAVSGPLGADVLDYIDRDAVNCGLDHRVDSAIFRQLRLDSTDPSNPIQIRSDITGKYGLRIDREYAVVSLLEERYAMFLKVYAHSAKIAADVVLGKAIEGAKIRESEYEWLGDETLIDLFCRSRREAVKKLGHRLRHRALPRGAYRASIYDVVTPGWSVFEQRDRLQEKGYLSASGRADIENKISRKAKIDSADLFFYCPKNPPGFKRAESPLPTSSEAYARSLNQISEIGKRHLELWDMWVLVADADVETRNRVAKAAEELLERENIIEQYRRPQLGLNFR